MVSLSTLCSYILEHEQAYERHVTNLRLQKLLYFIQASFIQETGEPCFGEEIQAWTYGPVVPDAYRFFRKYGSCILPPDFFSKQSVEPLSKEDSKLISQILEMCSEYTVGELIDVSHTQPPWQNAYEKGDTSLISVSSMREYFCPEEGDSP